MESWSRRMTTLPLTMICLCLLSFLSGCENKSAMGDSPNGESEGTSLPQRHAGLLDPSRADLKAPPTFKVEFQTTKGDFVVFCRRDLAPRGADRFFSLVTIGYYDGAAFYRVVPGFVVQWGINADPRITETWSRQRIQDDPVRAANLKGTLSFAMGGPNTRSTQVFINLRDNRQLDGMGFAPFGEVVSGMDVVMSLDGRYGDRTLQDSERIARGGDKYLRRRWPGLDRIVKARILEE